MSSETFSLRARGDHAPTSKLWNAIWRIAWSRVEKLESEAVRAWRAPYFEDLLPDQESRLMQIDPAVDADGLWRVGFDFPDFGGSFSTSITLISDWFVLGLADQYEALHRTVVAAGFEIDAELLPRLDVELARAPRTVIEHEGRLFIAYREGDAIVLASDAGSIAAPDAVAERAQSLLDAHGTEDPVRAALGKRVAVRAQEREEHEREWMGLRVERLLGSLGPLSEHELLDAMLSRRDPPARAFLERKGAMLARPIASHAVLARHLGGARKHEAIALVARGFTSAKAAEKDGLAALVRDALTDPEIALDALAVELDDKHRDATFFARLLDLMPRLDARQLDRVASFVVRALERRWPKGEPTPDLAPLIVILLEGGAGLMGLRGTLASRQWSGDGSLEAPVEALMLARVEERGVGEDDVVWLLGAIARRSAGPIAEGGVPANVRAAALDQVVSRGSEDSRFALFRAWAERRARTAKRSGRKKAGAVVDPVESAFREAFEAQLAHADADVRAQAAGLLQRYEGSIDSEVALCASALGRLEGTAHRDARIALLRHVMRHAGGLGFSALADRLALSGETRCDAALLAVGAARDVRPIADVLEHGDADLLVAACMHWLATAPEPTEQNRRAMRLTWVLIEIATATSLATCCAVAERAFAVTGRADLLYQWACAHARAGQLDAAAEVLARAIELDPKQRDDARGDQDFTKHLEHPGLATLLR